MMELIRDAKNVKNATAVLMIQADLGPTLFDHASLKVETLCSAQVRPIRLNVYAAVSPMIVSIIVAGSNANLESEKNAIPEGRARTPAPIILLARLNVEDAMVASPPSFAVFTDGAAAEIISLTSTSLFFRAEKVSNLLTTDDPILRLIAVTLMLISAMNRHNRKKDLILSLA